MHKILLPLLLVTSFSFAGLINGIALTVNNEPITLYDIDEVQTKKKLDRQKATAVLIDRLLYKQQLKKYNVEVDIFETDEYMKKLANANKMDVVSFRAMVRQKYTDFSKFENEVKGNILRQKLLQKIIKGNLKPASNEDIQVNYDNNLIKYQTAGKIEAIEYASKNKNSLIAVQNNPMLALKDVQTRQVNLDMSTINPKLKFIINSTKTDKFTDILVANKNYVTLLILKKSDTYTAPVSEVKEIIFMEIMKEREKRYLKEYFDKQKLTADIKVIR